MRNIQYAELCDPLWMQQRRAPRNGRAPIVPSEKEALRAKAIGDGHDVGNEMDERVIRDAARLAAQIVTALIGRDYTKPRRRERFNLFVPRIPKFGKTVEKHDHRTVGRARSNSV